MSDINDIKENEDLVEEDIEETYNRLISSGKKNDKIILKKMMYDEEKKRELLVQGYICCEEDEEGKEYMIKRNEIIELWENIKSECEEYNDIYNKILFKNMNIDELYELIYGKEENDSFNF